MRALVVYESLFGNTRMVAHAIADGLRTGSDDDAVDVEVVEVSDAPGAPGSDVDVVVVGGPTHAFGLSHANTRASAVEQATDEVPSTGIGLRDWLEGLPRATTAAAAFDTHIDKRIPGSAARAADKRLRRRGYRAVVPPESFFVSDTTGPLVDGEEQRARTWGQRIARTASGARTRAQPS